MDTPPGLPPERRALLSRKGQTLYGKSCNTPGRETCAEGFALHHLRKGEKEVAEDFLAFLDRQLAALRQHDPEGRLARTEALRERIRTHLEAQAGEVA